MNPFKSPGPNHSSFPHRAYSVDVVMECVRGLAAMWVFLFHVPDLVLASFPQLYPITSEGHRGVSVFFAVSGYCIFAAAQRCVSEKTDSLHFLRRRLRRIFPTFWASIVVVLVLPYVLEALSAVKSGGMHWPGALWLQYTALDWLGVVTLTKELLDTARGGGQGYTLLNSVYWTLAIEVQFYLVLYAAISYRRRWIAILGLVSTASVLALALSGTTWNGFFLQFWPAFACGMLLRIAFLAGLTPKACFGRHELSGSIVLGVLAGALVVLLARSPHGISFLETAAASAFLLWVCGGIENACLAKGSAWPVARFRIVLLPFVLLGQCSYSLYLLHGKLFQLPDMVVRQLVPMSSPLHLVATVFATTLLCYLFYYFVERRFQGQPGHLKARPAAPAAVPLHGQDATVLPMVEDKAA
jgi:peptidoglycan/LPS O-acetylase OafA/YrhL